ncbi:hypothetical protein [Maricaulis sp.]|uniref:hypothetical protein n=1 Tax=Maricaulis sp. TaxID=1486257 RepID=UPI003A905F63
MLHRAVENVVVGACLLLLSVFPISIYLGVAAFLGRYFAPNVDPAWLYGFAVFTALVGFGVVITGFWIEPEVRRVVRNWLRMR